MGRQAATTAPSTLELDLKRFRSVGYFAFGLIWFDQILQLVFSAQGFGVSPSAGRFQFATFLAARSVPLFVALVGVLALATMVDNRRLVRFLVGGFGLMALVLAAGALVLWIDGSAIKGSVGADDLRAFTAQWIRGLVISSVGILLFGGTAIGLRKRV